MTYDPFARGPFPVGVRSFAATDAARAHRHLPLEVWYPATATHRGQDTAAATQDAYELLPGFPPIPQDAVRDAAPASGAYPLIAFSHGFGGHRRQSTFLCTHWASHGYVVAAVDHTGNTVVDMMQAMMAVQTGGALPDEGAVLREFIEARPVDVSFAVDFVLNDSAPELRASMRSGPIGMSGHSFGGWTTLAVTGRDRRIGAALPLAPAGGATPLAATAVLGEALSFEWGRDVPTLFLVADRDTLLPLPGMHELFGKTRASKQMVVLQRADHMHFCDRVEETHEMFRIMPMPGVFGEIQKRVPPISELCSGAEANQAVRGLGLAHMDAHLKGDEAAARFLTGDLTATLASRGMAVETVRP